MGRVAKYKKVKSFDPYSKKNNGNLDLSTVGVWGLGDDGRKPKKRSRRAEMLRSKKKRRTDNNDSYKFDLPPTEKDEFNMSDLVGSVKKQTVENPLKASEEVSTKEDDALNYSAVQVGSNRQVVATIPKTDKDEKEVARILKLDIQVEKKLEEKSKATYDRMEGESKRAYARRTKTETRHIIKKATGKNREKIQKKKEFLNNKKKKRKKNGQQGSNTKIHSHGGDDYSSGDVQESSSFITGEQAVLATTKLDPVRFGEQVERPPVFRQLPRGAKRKAKPEKTNETTKSKRMSEEDIEPEKNAVEMIRRRVQVQYAAIKAKRRRAGDFHL